jgi:transposase
MLRVSYAPMLSDQDQLIFETLVPPDHYLRQVNTVVDFERYRVIMAACYSSTEGRPADDPVVLLKVGFLQTHYNLSDREVLAATQVNVAFRYFLNLALTDTLPHPSLLTVFRARLGASLYQQIFDGVVSQARAAHLVKDRLRLKDATHIIANIAIPSTIRLIAQIRQRLLAAAEPFAADQVTAERAHALAIRTATADLSDEERLLARVTHLHQIVAWADPLSSHLGRLPQELSPARRAFADALALAHKILADRDDPDGGDQVVSVHDVDARRGKHGAYFTGYLLDVALDADSQIITALEVLPANGDEAADATSLIAREETVHDNDVQTLSIDKAGFRGELLREWQDPEGLDLEVVVPPTSVAPSPYFTAEDFTHAQEAGTLTCPSNVTTARRTRNRVDTGWKYVFPRDCCATCPLQGSCLERLPKATGRMVVINDYAAEYAAARQKAATAAYRQVRREHPAIERKLAEMMRQHDGRWARYRGRGRNRIQYLLTGLVVNVKRMVRLLLRPPQAQGRCAAVYPIAG